MKPLWIYGAGGFAREVFALITEINRIQPTWIVQGFVVDPDVAAPESLKGLPVVRSRDMSESRGATWWVVAIGNPAVRQKIVTSLQAYKTVQFATLVHPRAWIGPDVAVGEGCVICAGVSITTDIGIGAHVHVNLGCTIGHDASVGAFNTLSPGVHVSGGVMTGEGCDIGTGAVILPRLTLGAKCVIGAGSVVTKSLDAQVVAVGVPARIMGHAPGNT